MFKPKTIEEKVKDILRTHPETRDNDTRLIFTYWIKKDNIPLTEIGEQALNNPKKLASAESITRARRKIQNHQHLYKAKYKIEQYREDLQQKYVKWYGGTENE